MSEFDFSFEQSPWDLFLESNVNNSVSAAQFLTLLEGESDDAVENALLDLEEACISLDISDLPMAPGTGEAALRLRHEQQLAKGGLKPDALEPGDPLRLYLEELAAIPACGDIRLLSGELANANRAGKDRNDLRAALVNLSLSRVVALAGEYTGYGVLLLDLIQEGSLGLWQGTVGFTGEDYETSRDWWIRFYLARAVVLQARAGGVGQKMRQAMEDYRSVDERLLSELGRNATIEEIAEELHMTADEATAVKKTLDNARILAQAKRTPEPEEEEASEEADQAVENTALFQMRQRIMDLLSSLSEQDAKLLTLRFGLEGGMPLSPADTGKRLGLTPDEVVAREAAALAKLRNG